MTEATDHDRRAILEPLTDSQYEVMRQMIVNPDAIQIDAIPGHQERVCNHLESLDYQILSFEDLLLMDDYNTPIVRITAERQGE